MIKKIQLEKNNKNKKLLTLSTALLTPSCTYYSPLYTPHMHILPTAIHSALYMAWMWMSLFNITTLLHSALCKSSQTLLNHTPFKPLPICTMA